MANEALRGEDHTPAPDRWYIVFVLVAAAILAPLLIVAQLSPYEALRLRGTATQTSDFPVD